VVKKKKKKKTKLVRAVEITIWDDGEKNSSRRLLGGLGMEQKRIIGLVIGKWKARGLWRIWTTEEHAQEFNDKALES